MAKLGRKGENFFESLCLDANLTVNRSIMDETGWDFYVEFPLEYQKEMELVPSPIECKVQVKATEGNSGRVSIKLTNLFRFIKDPKPSFFIFFKYEEGQREPLNAYLVHVDKNIIRGALTRIRKEDQSGENYKLHEKTMDITYTDENLLDELTGECLANAIRDYIPEGINEYVIHKQKILDELSDQSSSGSLKFNINEQAYETLVDMSLGLENLEPAKIENVLATKERFGIVDHKPHLECGEAKIITKPFKPTSSGKVIFRSSKFASPEQFDADLYSSRLTFNLAKDKQKIRIKGSFFDITFFPYSKIINFKFSLEGITGTLQTLRRTMNFVEKFFSRTSDYYVDFIFDGFVLSGLKLDKTINSTGILVDSNLISKACNISEFFDLPYDMIISLDALKQYESSISQMNNIITNSGSNFTDIVLKVNKTADLHKHDNVCFLFLNSSIIGDFKVAFILAIYGSLDEITEGGKEKYSLITEGTKIVRTIVANSKDDFEREEIMDEFEKAGHEFEPDYKVVIYY